MSVNFSTTPNGARFTDKQVDVDVKNISEAELPIRKSLRERSLEVRCPEQRPELVVDASRELEEAPSICIAIPTVIAWKSDC